MNPPRPIPSAIAAQLSQAHAVIARHCGPTLLGLHLYGSALNGGLKPFSDIDLLATVSTPPDGATRQALMRELLAISAPPGEHPVLRALEVTLVAHGDVVPWRPPARRLLQFGEWLRSDLQAGVFEPPVEDADLAILLTMVRQHHIALAGPPAEQLFEPVPWADVVAVLADTLNLWHTPADWAGDERNVVLALARIWYSASTGHIAPKDVAADWALPRLPAEHQPVLLAARRAYLGLAADRLAHEPGALAAHIRFVKTEAARCLQDAPQGR